MSGNAFRGVSLEQDKRYTDKEEKELKKLKFPENFAQSVDIKKVNLDVIRVWVAKRTTELMNNVEDEFLINYIVAMLEDTPKLDPRKMQVAVIGFIGKRRAGIFMSELWTLLLDAQEHDGIPSAMIEQTRSELQKRREEAQRIREGIAASEQREGRAESWKPPSFAEMEQEKREEREKRGQERGARRDFGVVREDRRGDRKDFPDRRDDRRNDRRGRERFDNRRDRDRHRNDRRDRDDRRDNDRDDRRGRDAYGRDDRRDRDRERERERRSERERSRSRDRGVKRERERSEERSPMAKRGRVEDARVKQEPEQDERLAREEKEELLKKRLEAIKASKNDERSDD